MAKDLLQSTQTTRMTEGCDWKHTIVITYGAAPLSTRELKQVQCLWAQIRRRIASPLTPHVPLSHYLQCHVTSFHHNQILMKVECRFMGLPMVIDYSCFYDEFQRCTGCSVNAVNMPLMLVCVEPNRKDIKIVTWQLTLKKKKNANNFHQQMDCQCDMFTN